MTTHTYLLWIYTLATFVINTGSIAATEKKLSNCSHKRLCWQVLLILKRLSKYCKNRTKLKITSTTKCYKCQWCTIICTSDVQDGISLVSHYYALVGEAALDKYSSQSDCVCVYSYSDFNKNDREWDVGNHSINITGQKTKIDGLR